MVNNPISDASTINFYDLLSLPDEYWPSTDVSAPPLIPSVLLRKSYHKACLLYHPDKNSSSDAVPFHLVTTAYEVLNDPVTKALYDNKLRARMVRKLTNEREKKRKLKEELERQFETAQEQGRRLRMMREEALRTVAMENGEGEEQRRRRRRRTGGAEEAKDDINASISNKATQRETSQFSDLDRTLMIKLWHLSDFPDPQLTSESVIMLFAPFGKVSDCIIHDNSTSTTPNTSKKKKPILAFVVFADIKDAHTVVCAFREGGASRARKGSKELWERVKEVKWAGSRGEYWRSPLTPASSGSRRAPGMSMKDYEAVTLMKMREMELRNLEEETRRREREEEAKAEGREEQV
ncbi:hypothetical protein BDZ91DRAFT_784369 [Kalaharituber pfeilii]|nr:hypothetical protein BDZ91DRAFT_784369 [Kalaharituber pfeilii]